MRFRSEGLGQCQAWELGNLIMVNGCPVHPGGGGAGSKRIEIQLYHKILLSPFRQVWGRNRRKQELRREPLAP